MKSIVIPNHHHHLEPHGTQVNTQIEIQCESRTPFVIRLGYWGWAGADSVAPLLGGS